MPSHPVHPEIDLLDGDFYAKDPHPHFRWMRENAPVYRDPKHGVWGITRHEDIMALSKDSRSFVSSRGMRPDYPEVDNMICMDDPMHKHRRNLVNRGFTKRRVLDQEPKLREICRELVERASAKGEFDFVRDVAAPLPMIMIGDMLGVLPEDRETLLRWSDDIMAGLTGVGDLDAEKVVKMQRANEEYRDYCLKVVEERRKTGSQEDLMGVLVHAEIDGERLDDEALFQESLLILIGGDETTRHVISGGMHQLLLHPEERQKLIDDPARIPGAVEEMLRWVTPILNMARTPVKDIALRGQTIPAGEKCVLLYPSGNRDEAIFDDPYRFDVERDPNTHVAFGGYGTHFCLGASLARMELRVMFEEIVSRAPNWELASSEPPRYRPSNFITGIEELPMRVPGA